MSVTINQNRLWEDIKSGRITSYRQAKERRHAPQSAQEEQSQRVSPVAAAGRSFLSRLEKLSDDELRSDQALFQELVQLQGQLTKRLKAVRKAMDESGKQANAGDGSDSAS